MYDDSEKIESVEKSVIEIINKCGIRRIQAVFERTTTTRRKIRCGHSGIGLPSSFHYVYGLRRLRLRKTNKQSLSQIPFYSIFNVVVVVDLWPIRAVFQTG